MSTATAAVPAFRLAMQEAGISPPASIIPDGKLRRFHIEGDRRGRRNGWYVLHGDHPPAGVFGCWRRGITCTWHDPEGAGVSSNPGDWGRQPYAARAAREAEEQRVRERAAKRARRLWNAARAADPAHPYLKRKQVQAYGIRQDRARLLLRLVDTDGTLHGLQYIGPDSEKRFLPGTAKKGRYHPIGKPDGTLVIAEGYATAATIHQATGYAVAVAFDAGNLKPVAEALRAKFPDLNIIVAADNDHATPGNPGGRKATQAARAVNGRLAVPHFDKTDDGTDWNDLAALHGLEAVRAGIFGAEDSVSTSSTGATGATGATRKKPGRSADPGSEDGTGATGARLPRGFSVDNGGVWYNPPAERGKDRQAREWICSQLDVTALTRNADGEDWGRLLEFADPDGRHHLWACPMEALAGDGAEFRRVLLSMGLRISTASNARQRLATYVQATKVQARATCVERTGWHGSVYVLPETTVGEQGGEWVLLQTLREQPRLRQAGTLDEWRGRVAALCVGNSRLVLAVSMAFAAALLELTGDESGGIHFVGASSTGKTTTLWAATSVWGGRDYLHRWRATANGIEAVAQMHNDALLVLDELAQVDPREAGTIAYMLANGTGKHRARRDGMARRAATWRLLFLSAGEVGLADHMREAGKQSRAGQEIRLVDVPADAGAGHGIFENLHGHPGGAALADALIRATTDHHGTVARAYLARLVATQREELCRSIEALRSDFVNDVVPPGADGQARRVAARFGLVAAGGELATSFGLTGWQPGEAIRAAAVCYRAWLDRRGGAGAMEEAQALAQVRHFIEAHGEARFSDLDAARDRPTVNRAGFRRRSSGTTEYFILPEVFKREVCVGFDPRFVARVLRTTGCSSQTRWTV